VRVGLIGLGAIAHRLVCLLQPDDDVQVVGAIVRHLDKPRAAWTPRVCATPDDLLACQPDVVVEAGGHEALRACGPAVLRAGVDLLVVSVGALADPALERLIVEAAREGRSRATVASGAIGALDALASAAVGGLTRVTHITRKPANALLPPDEARALTAPRELFRGCAREGVLRFPESVNVAAAVSLAGIGLDRTELRVIADPALERNTHEVIAEGAFGELRFSIRNVPTQENPRTGELVAMSVLHCLRRRQAPLAIG
jgi:aspartate dehydrogenase